MEVPATLGELTAMPSTTQGAPTAPIGLPTNAFKLAPPKGRAMRCTVLALTSNLAAVLRTLMPPTRAALIRSASLSAIGGRPRRLPSHAWPAEGQREPVLE